MKKILVVDDSKTIRTLCEFILKGTSETLVAVDSIAAAKAEIAKGVPNVLLLDYTLPDGDSLTFCKTLKADGIPVILMGGHFAKFDENAAREAGADDVIVKPFKSDPLLNMIRKVTNEEEGVATSEANAPTSGINAAARATSLPTVSEISAVKAVPKVESSSVHPVPTAGQPHTQSGVRRFNFPVAGTQDAGIPAAGPKAQIPSVRSGGPASVGRLNTVPGIQPISASSIPSNESATPKTPLPSVPPTINETPAQYAIDPAVLRAEVQAAVKEILPSVVRSVLKKLIVTEVTPQIQTWVDNRVEALVKKLMH